MNQSTKGRVTSIKRPGDVTDDDASESDQMDADLIWSSSQEGHTSDEDGIRPRIVESERFSITSDDIPTKPHEWGGASFSENTDDDFKQTSYDPPPQRPLTAPLTAQKTSNRNILGLKLNDPKILNNTNTLQLQQLDNRVPDRQIKSYNAILEERPQTTVGVQVGITSWDWLSRLEQLLIHFFLIIFDSSSDFSKTLMEVFPVEASSQIEEIFRLLLQADPEMYENLGYLVGMAEKWLVQWNSKSSTKKEALEFIRLYMIGCKHRNYYSVPIYARLQKLGAFISGLQNLSGTAAGGGDNRIFTAKQIKDFNLESEPPAIEKAAWEKRLPSPRVKPASHFARVVAHILCDRPCERPMTSPDIYADPVTKTCVPTNLATETELTTLTDVKYGSQYNKRDLFFYPALAIPRNRPVKVDPCNKKCWLPVYTESYVEMVQDEMEECATGGKGRAATAAAQARLRRKKIEQYEVEYEYEYEDEPEYEYEYEYEIELDKDGNPIYGADGKPKLKLGADGKPILKLGADGKPILLLGADGKPIVRRGSNGQPIVRRDSKGRIIYKIGADGKRVPKLDENGRPILKLNSQGQKILKLGKDGKPIIKMENGRPVYKLGADGKRVKRIPGSQESLIDENVPKRKMGAKEFHEKEKARAQEKKERLKQEAELERKKKKKEKRELDRLKAKDEREHRKGGKKGKKGNKRGNRKNRGSGSSDYSDDEEFSDEELSDGTKKKKRHRRKSRKSDANSLGVREGGKSGEIIPGDGQGKSQEAAGGKDAVRVGYALTAGESGAVAVKRANRKAQELAKAKAKANEKAAEQKSDRKYGDEDKKKLLKNIHQQGDMAFDVDFEERVETFPLLSVRKRQKSARLDSYPDGDFGDGSRLLLKSKNRAGDKDQHLQDALSKSRLRDTGAVSGKRRTEVRKPSGKEFRNVNVRGKVERTVYRPPSRIRQPRKTQGLFDNEKNKDRSIRLVQPRAAISLQRLRRPIHLKRTFRYPGGQFDYDRNFGQEGQQCGRNGIDCGKSRSEGVLSGSTVEEEEACYYFPTKFDCRPHKKQIRERIAPNNFPRYTELPNLNKCWDLDSDLFKKPMKGIGIPPPENILAHIEKIFPMFKWPKGSPLAVRYYPNGRIFCATFKNGSGEVFYPHGGLAIAISNPNPVNRVLIIRDPYDKFYFMDKAILADLDCSGKGSVYNSNGATSLQYNSIGGFRLQGDDKNCYQRWTWIRGGQRMILKLNRYMSLRILDFNRIHLVFNGNKRGVRFNVGPGRIINLMNVELDEKYLAIEAGKHGESCYDDHFDYNRGKFTTPTLGFFDNSRFCPDIIADPSLTCPLDCNSNLFKCAVSDPCLCDCVN